MSILDKAFKAASLLARKTAIPDVGETIRSALTSAGLMSGGEASREAPGPFSCMAPPGAPRVPGAFAPDWRRARGLMPDAEPVMDTQGDFTWRSITGPWGTRRYRLFVPPADQPPVALLVMLHGCTQNPDDFAAGTRMNAVAAAHNVAVAYPEQIRGANAGKCWNWFEAAHQHKGGGEPALIAAIARNVMAEHKIPDGHAFVAGLSAGGAMAAVMAHTDPDLFAAAGIHSGLPYLAASDMASALSAMRSGAGGTRGAGTGVAGVPAIIFHGDADHTVHVSNADALVARLSEAGQRPTVQRGATEGGRGYVRTIGRSATGAIRFEDWRLTGAGHAWSGGSRAGSYTDPDGPDASREMMRFFLEQIPARARAVPTLTRV